jgi:hypothetical protein
MMTQPDIDAARGALLNARQAAYEAYFNAIVANDKPGKTAAKQTVNDLADREDAINNIQAVFTQLHP